MALPRGAMGCLWSVIVVFPDHTHLLLLTKTNGPVATAINCNVQLYVFSHIPDSFLGVAEMVLDHLPKSSKVNFATELN